MTSAGLLRLQATPERGPHRLPRQARRLRGGATLGCGRGAPCVYAPVHVEAARAVVQMRQRAALAVALAEVADLDRG